MTGGYRKWTVASAAVLLTLPFLALLPMGFIWLLQQEWSLYWLGFLAACAATATFILRPRSASTMASTPFEATPPPEPNWTPREHAAWAGVQAIARQVDGRLLTDRAVAMNTLRHLLDTVARHYHRGKEPIWEFTLPEALLLVEHVSRQLRRSILADTPALRGVRVGRVVTLLRWKAASATLWRAGNGTWRVLRLANPAKALLAEAGAHFKGQAAGVLNELVLKTVARRCVERVGEVAINFYSGRLRLDDDASVAPGEAPLAPAASPPRPLRILIGGAINAGKSSLVNALCADAVAPVDALPVDAGFTTHTIAHDALPAATIIDSRGLDRAESVAAFVEHAIRSDMIVWVCAAHRGDRDLDRRTLAAIGHHFARHTAAHKPPVIVVMSHIDQLRPAREWSPPYDVAVAATAKARAIRDAMTAVADELGCDVDDVVPARLDHGSHYNVEVVWAGILAASSKAQQVQLVRCLRNAAAVSGWSLVLDQAAAVGRIISHRALGRRTWASASADQNPTPAP